MRKLALLISAVVIASLVFPAVAGAGGSPKKPPVKLEGKVNNEGTKTVKKGSIGVEADDFYFKATFLKAKPGSTIKVKLENEGNAPHTFTIDSLGVDQEIQPGKKATVTVKVPDSGATAFYCRFHKSSGMQGAIFTKAGASAASNKTPTTSGSTGGSGGYGY